MDAAINMLLSNAVLASMLAGLVFVVTRIWKNHFGAHVLWLLVLIKLLTPPLIGVPPQALLSGLMQNSNVEDRVVRVSQAPDTRDENQLLIEDTQDHRGQVSNRLQLAVNRHEPPEPQLSLRSVFVAIWLAGSVIWCLLASYRLTKFARLLRQHGSGDDQIQMVAKKVATAMRLRRCPQLVLTPAKVPPLVLAPWRPALLVLPRDFVVQLDPDQLETLLAHELAHLRRGDHWIRRYEMVVAAIYWWHPVMWWAVHELRVAEEKCCDAFVVQGFPKQVQKYGEVLLKAAEFACSPVPRAAIPISQGHQLRRRINMILNQAFSPRLSLTASLGVFVVAIAALPLAVPGMELAVVRPQPSVSVGGPAELEEEPAATANEEQTREGGEDDTASSTSPSKSKQLSRTESLRRRALLSLPKMSFGGRPDDKQVHLRVPLTADMVEELAGTENLGTVFLSREAGDHDLLLLKQVRMKSLFAEADITDRGVMALENHPTLESLHLRKPSITDNSFRSLSDIPRLTRVRIYDAQISDEALRFVAESAGAEHLKFFEFSQCPKLTSRMLKHIAKITSLTGLTLVNLQDLDEDDLNYLATIEESRGV